MRAPYAFPLGAVLALTTVTWAQQSESDPGRYLLLSTQRTGTMQTELSEVATKRSAMRSPAGSSSLAWPAAISTW